MTKTNVRGTQILDASVDLTVDVTNTLPVGNGGTGNATNTLNSLLVGNGTGAVLALAPSTTGKVAVSNGTSWTSSSSGVVLTSPKIDAILDTNGSAIIGLDVHASAVNNVTVYNSATGGGPGLYPTGTDSNIDIRITPKGTGNIQLQDRTFSPVLVATGVTSGVNYIVATGAAAGAAPSIAATGSDTNVDLNLISQGTGVVKANNVPVVTTTGAQTLTGKTLTTPKVDQLRDTNNAVVLHLQPNSSAVNYVEVDNAATGVDPQLYGWSLTDTNVGLDLKTKGTGTVKANSVPVVTTTGAQTLTTKTLTSPKINSIKDTTGNTLLDAGATVGGGTGVNFVYVANASAGNTPAIGTSGTDTNVGLSVFTQGTGAVNVNGVPVVAVSPGASGNVLTSNGTAWTSAAATGGSGEDFAFFAA